MTEKNVAFETIDLVRKPISAPELKKLLHRAGLKPIDAVRKNEPAYREAFAEKNLSDDQLIEVLAKHPELIQRPIVMRGEKAVLARPAEKLAELGIK